MFKKGPFCHFGASQEIMLYDTIQVKLVEVQNKETLQA